MAGETSRCPVCGEELTTGTWPWCPHPKGVNNVEQDTVEGGFTVENGFATPQTFYSKQEHRAALAANGFEICAKPKRAERTIDAQTLENARILVSRANTVQSDESPAVPVTFFEKHRADLMLRVKAVV